MDVLLAGSTNQSIVFVLDVAELTIANMKLGYVRWSDGNGTTFTEVLSSALVALATITTAHTDNRAIYLDAEATGGNKFILRVDFPDAAFASGKNKVICNIYDDGNNVVAFRIFSLDPIASNIKQIDDVNNVDATFNLKSFNVINDAGDAVNFKSTGGDGEGLKASGHGTGRGFQAIGGANDSPGFESLGNGNVEGVLFKGGSGGGPGIKYEAQNNDNGATYIKQGTGKDIDAFEIDVLGYPNGYIVYNPGATTNTSTVLGTDGTLIKPVTTMAAAMNLRGQLKTGRILLAGPTGESINGLDMTNTEFRAINKITLTGITSAPDLSGSRFYNITLSGIFTDSATTEYYDCSILGTVLEFGTFYRCKFSTGTYLIQSEGAGPVFINCFSIGTPTFTIDSASIDIHNWSGPIIVNATAIGTVVVYATEETFLTTNSIQAGSTFLLRGLGNFVNNSGGSIPDVTDFIDVSDIGTGDGDATLANQTTLLAAQANQALDTTVSKEATAAKDATVAKDSTVSKDATVAKEAAATSNAVALNSNIDSNETKINTVISTGGAGPWTTASLSAVTLDNSAANKTVIAEGAWDAQRSTHNSAGSFGEKVLANIIEWAGSASIDGVTLTRFNEIMLAYASGRFRTNFPNPGDISFFKQDNTTTAYVMNTTTTGRTRI